MQGNQPPYGQYQQPGPYPRPQGYGAPGYGPPPGYPQHSPHAPYGVHPVLGIPYSGKSKMAAGLLQIFVGFGIGRFYTGHIGLGVAQLLVCLLVGVIGAFFTCGVSLVVLMWPFIDGIVLMAGDSTDSEGYPLRS